MLPTYVKPEKLQADPGGRPGHAYYPPADEVFNVGQVEFEALCPHLMDSVAHELPAGGNKVDSLLNSNNRDELVAMAEELGIEVSNSETKREIAEKIVDHGV